VAHAALDEGIAEVSGNGSFSTKVAGITPPEEGSPGRIGRYTVLMYSILAEVWPGFKKKCEFAEPLL
jgi:hypothetical protein